MYSPRYVHSLCVEYKLYDIVESSESYFYLHFHLVLRNPFSQQNKIDIIDINNAPITAVSVYSAIRINTINTTREIYFYTETVVCTSEKIIVF